VLKTAAAGGRGGGEKMRAESQDGKRANEGESKAKRANERMRR
jgi:hypothetical protein